MENLLKVENTYKKLKRKPKLLYEKKLKAFVKKGKDEGILNKKEAAYLLSESMKTPVIYYVPKIHKRKEKPREDQLLAGSTHSSLT